MLKKNIIFIIGLLLSSSVCLAAAGIADSVDGTSVSSFIHIPEPIYKTIGSVPYPYPTNKWFNSIVYNADNDNKEFSLKMYTYPQVVKCESSGFLIEKPTVVFSSPIGNNPYQINYGVNPYNGRSIDNYPNMLKVSAYKTAYYNTGNPIQTTSNGVKLNKYSDWTATALWTDDYDNTKYMKTTFGQGFLFTYFEFSNIYPAIEFPYDWNSYNDNFRYILYDTRNGEKIIDNGFKSGGEDVEYIYENDSLLLHAKFPSKDIFYAIFVPEGTKFYQVQDSAYTSAGLKRPWIKTSIILPDDQKYMSVALLPSDNLQDAKNDMKKYYKYAYNFVSKTNADWSVKKKNNLKYARTDFGFTFDVKRNGTGSIFGENVSFENNKTFFCLFPHQCNADNFTGAVTAAGLSKTNIRTLRGDLKIYEGNKFSTENKIYGIVPFFQSKLSGSDKTKIQTELENDKNLSIDPPLPSATENKRNTYYYGKNLAKIANLIPVSDGVSSQSIKEELITKLKNELENWFSYSSGKSEKYFFYDTKWGGLIGVGDPQVFNNTEYKYSFGTEQYNDHNFHYGYFIYAAAILAMNDSGFAANYGSIVELLIKDIANGNKNDIGQYPFMRHFDFYESHSWANGMGGANDDGIDIESSSEAMNAWAAIYMWGLATKNDYYINLGLYLYTSEYQAVKNYFFVTGKDSAVKDIFAAAGYTKKSFGILYGGLCKYSLHWTPGNDAREIKGIQLLPMTPSLLYLGYDKEYAQSFYDEMKTETPVNYYWNDIWSRFKALFNPSEAWTDFAFNHGGAGKIDDGGTASYTYHFINFFKQYGTPDFSYTADVPSYLVLSKSSPAGSSAISRASSSRTSSLTSDGDKTFCAYNYTDTPKDVRFYDSFGNYLGYLTVAANSFNSSSVLQNSSDDDKKFSVYPVPYKPNSGGKYDGDGITFSGITPNSDIKIFNIAGEKVFETVTDSVSSSYLWNGKNNYGNNVASGVYIYYIKSQSGTKKGKIAIER